MTSLIWRLWLGQFCFDSKYIGQSPAINERIFILFLGFNNRQIGLVIHPDPSILRM